MFGIRKESQVAIGLIEDLQGALVKLLTVLEKQSVQRTLKTVAQISAGVYVSAKVLKSLGSNPYKK